MGGQPGNAESWEPRDKVFPKGESSQLCRRMTIGSGKTEVSGNLDKSSFVEWWGWKPSWQGSEGNGRGGAEAGTLSTDSSCVLLQSRAEK